MMNPWRGACATTAIICCLSTAKAQESSPHRFSLTAVSASSLEANPGSTISIAFSVHSNASDSLTVVPSAAMPEGWSLITGSDAFALAPHERDTWIIGVFVPVRAVSTRYYLHIAAHTVGGTLDRASETIQIDVKRTHGVGVALVKYPEYVVAGHSYEVGFRVKNRGNGVAEIHLAAQSLVDSAVVIDAADVHLRADGDTTVTVRVNTSVKGSDRADDVVQISAVERGAPTDSVPAIASARVTVVPAPGAGEPLATVPTTVAVRAASASAGVSPIEIAGSGKLRPDRDESVDFLFHGKSGLNSPFGDERNNRFELRSTSYRARLGDHVFGLSTLTAMGQMGFGAGLELTRGLISSDAYSQQFRYTPGRQRERGLNIALNPNGLLSGYHVSLNAVDRSGGPFAGRVVSSALRLPTVNEGVLDAEFATSTATAARGYSNLVRLIGGHSFRYDVGHVGGDAVFAGPSRNSQNDYASFSFPATRTLQLNAALNRSRFAPGLDSTLPRQEFAGATIGALYAGRLLLEYSGLGRTMGGDRWHLAETQRFAKARIDQASPFGSSWLALEMGERGDSASNGRTYHSLQIGTSVNTALSSLSVYSELYDGGSLTRGLPGMTTLGGSASIRITNASSLSVFGYTARNHIGSARSYSQIDARLSHVLTNGARISARVRSATIALGAPTQKLAYAEFSVPLGVPTGRIPRPGRAIGTVTDGESGRALSGVLVRVGPRAGVTDGDGKVSFSGLAPGEYRASLASEASISNAAYTGNPVVKIDSARHEAVAFQLAVSRASRIRGTVRQFAAARTALGGEADSLEYAGSVPGMTIALAGASDTLYRTTDANGRFSFDEIASGRWMIFVDSDVASGCLIEHPRVSVVTKPGEEILVDFRVVPRRKRVKFIAGPGSIDSTSTRASPSPTRD